MNGKIVTKHSAEQVFRVWNMKDFGLCYVLKHPKLEEFKIW